MSAKQDKADLLNVFIKIMSFLVNQGGGDYKKHP